MVDPIVFNLALLVGAHYQGIVQNREKKIGNRVGG